jgi:integrase
MRHSAATWMLTGGVNVKAVAARLGHENAFQTLKTYAHVMPEADERIVEVFRRSLWEWQPNGNNGGQGEKQKAP